MTSTLSHQVLSSVKEFFNYRLLKDISAYTNRTIRFTSYTDTKLPSYYVYGASYAGFVYNSGVSGPTICSGVNNPAFISKGTGLYVDYRNGRIISPTAITGTISGSVSVPDFNLYVTTYSDYRLLHETNLFHYPAYVSTGYVTPYSHVTSAVFFRMVQTKNEDLSLGGLDWSTYNIKVTTMAKDNYKLSAFADVFRDSNDRIFPLLTGTPLNEFNDLKAGWDYGSYIAAPSSYGFITDATFNYFENDSFSDKNPSMEVGLANLQVRIPRQPHTVYP